MYGEPEIPTALCTQPYGFACQPLRGTTLRLRRRLSAFTRLGAREHSSRYHCRKNFFSRWEKPNTQKLQPSAYCRRLSNSKKIIKKIRKKQSIVIFFSILNIQKLEMPVWHSKSRTKWRCGSAFDIRRKNISQKRKSIFLKSLSISDVSDISGVSVTQPFLAAFFCGSKHTSKTKRRKKYE